MDYPVIALGDFNSTPPGLPKSKVSEKNENAMMFLFNQKGFVSYLNEADHQGGFTFPSENPDRRIDWIIGKGIDNFSNSKIIKSYLSDHLMIVTELLGSDSFVQN
jgi:endonuclease/exonuclease/phosphatase family metal-dependent hydrolase